MEMDHQCVPSTPNFYKTKLVMNEIIGKILNDIVQVA